MSKIHGTTIPSAVRNGQQIVQVAPMRVQRGLTLNGTAVRTRGGSLGSTMQSIGFSVSSVNSTGISSTVFPVLLRMRCENTLLYAIAPTVSIASVAYTSVASTEWTDWIEIADVFEPDGDEKLWGASPNGGRFDFEMRCIHKPAD